MSIRKIIIHNFKIFRNFEIELNPGMNILVGDNESGKSTILEAIHLAHTGFYHGRHIQNELSSYLINSESINEYIDSMKTENPVEPPKLMIEIYFDGSINPEFEGNGNTDREQKCEGFRFEIAFDEQYKSEYDELIKKRILRSLPIEYYRATWTRFDRNSTTTRMIPVKSVLIDSANYRYQNGSDLYIARIVRDTLNDDDVIAITQAHRRLIDDFARGSIIEDINNKINTESTLVDGDISLSANQGTKDAWMSSLVTQVSGVPFSHIGKGAQCIIKTELALSHKKTSDAGIILLEEPENHLSFTKLSRLISMIGEKYSNKQIIISTHSSFVANKLGLSNLILLKNERTTRLSDLDASTFFQKLSGYDTLRLVLCKTAILVEGPSDELIVQRAYMDSHGGRLPIDDSIDVISVGLSFLRFLEIADKLEIPTAVVTDNDGDLEALRRKYSDYIEEKAKPYIKICYDGEIDEGESENSSINYNTLEPKLLKANSRPIFNKIFSKNFESDDDLIKYMIANKTDRALSIFNSEHKIDYPNYIKKAIKNE